ncbi:MAG: hypothetical protein ACPGWR_22940 [Ardenticatenaceae bacterium]
MNEYNRSHACVRHSLRLNAFVSGLLNEQESDALILHTSECEACFEELNQLWMGSQFALSEEIPKRDSLATRQLEKQVFRSLHRSNMWAQFIWLATKGILQVVFGVLRPFFSVKWGEIFKKAFPQSGRAAESAPAKE